MPTNKQRREAERRRLQRQLEERRQRQAARQKATLVASIIGSLVLIAAIVVTVVLLNSGNDSSPTASKPTTSSTVPSTTVAPTSASSSPVPVPTAACATASGKSSVTFDGVTVGNATNLKVAPKITSKGTAKPTLVQCADLVVGKGAAATPASTVSVQYAGALYTNGKAFDSSWARGGKAVSFPLSGVIGGFKQGIGGAGKVAAMHVGGRRLIIVPPGNGLGYGASAQSSIPANSVLVFVVDLTKVS